MFDYQLNDGRKRMLELEEIVQDLRSQLVESTFKKQNEDDSIASDII